MAYGVLFGAVGVGVEVVGAFVSGETIRISPRACTCSTDPSKGAKATTGAWMEKPCRCSRPTRMAPSAPLNTSIVPSMRPRVLICGVPMWPICVATCSSNARRRST